jgi:hypothetical protein
MMQDEDFAEAMSYFKGRMEAEEQLQEMRKTFSISNLSHSKEETLQCLKFFKLLRATLRITEEQEKIFRIRLINYYLNANEQTQQRDPDLKRIEEEMEAIRKNFGLSLDDDGKLDEGPPEYQELNRQYDEILVAKREATFRELGEEDLLPFDGEIHELPVEEKLHLFEAAIDKSEDNQARLEKLLLRYKNEFALSAQAGAYYAACGLIGACLETLLLLMCLRDAEKTKNARKKFITEKKIRSSLPEDVLKWGLKDLIDFSRESGYIDNEVAAVMNVIQYHRNLLHPARYLQDVEFGHIGHEEYKFTKAIYTLVEDIYNALKASPGQ